MDQARQMPGQEQQVIEFYRSNTEAQASLQAPIFEDKVVNFILEMAQVTEREITPEQLRAEIEAQTEADTKAAEEQPKKAPAKKKASSKAAGAKKAPAKPKAAGAKAKTAAKKDTDKAE